MKSFSLPAFAVAALLFVNGTKAQEAQFQWQSDFELENKFSDIVRADSLGNAWFTTTNKENDMFIEKQNAGESKPEFATKILSGDDDQTELRRILSVGDRFVIVYSSYDRKAQTLTFYKNGVSADGTLQFPSPVEFLKIPIEEKNSPGSSMVLVSADHSKIAISHRELEGQEFTWRCYDTNFTLLFTKQSGMYKNSKYGLVGASSFAVSNNGTIAYTAEKITINKKNGDWGAVEEWIYVLPAGSAGVDSAQIVCPAKGFTALTIDVTDERVAVAGMYTEKYAATGMYFSFYSIAEKRLLPAVVSPFTKELFVTPGALDATDGEPTLSRGSLELINSPNGYFLILDPVFRQSSGNPYGGSSVMFTLYTVSVISLNTEGRPNWIASIMRNQICSASSGMLGAFGVSTSVMLREDDFSLFGSVVAFRDGNLIFLMNDAPENAPQPSSSDETESVRKPKALTAQLITIDPQGNITRKIINNRLNMPHRWHVGYSYIGRGFIYTFGEEEEATRAVMMK